MNPASLRKPEIDFAVIGDSFEIMKRQWQPFVIAQLVAVVIGSVVQVPLNIVFQGVLAGAMQSESGAGFIVLVPLYLIMLMVSIVIQMLMQGGIMKMALVAVKGGTPTFDDFISVIKQPVPYIIAGVIVAIAAGIGYILCVLPVLIVLGITMFTLPNIIERKMAPMDAFKASIETLKPFWLMSALFYLVAAIVASLGVIACCIGILFTAPMLPICIALTYRNFGQLVAPVGGEGLTPYPRGGASGMPPMETPVSQTEAPASPPTDPPVDQAPPADPDPNQP